MARTGSTAGGFGGYVTDTIGPHLDAMIASLPGRMDSALAEGASEIEEYAKANAPWSDRTGAARDGLTADGEVDGGEYVITLYHTVDYGLWLELIQDGEFAIILPTLEAVGASVMERVASEVMEP